MRTTDDKVLGVVGERYRIVQNREAFAWTDALLGEGVKYETAITGPELDESMAPWREVTRAQRL